ncbi:Uncharacterised protein [Sphingobacterium spiritivorum]|uniref:Uncharacterized protein n=1 Tax=Sphingobacterium spiritivorum TaxID=258 RepID=A0A380CA63_SPHSI|nr:hypothetical protein [Sphingobacterium spiritivorum]SUJ14589.1 Uncharacterised protein [Sphingobacterium spiritivorum]
MIDGKFDDWKGVKFQYDDQNKLNYAFQRDNDFLYIRILKDYNGRKVIVGGGIQLFFDKKETDSTSFTISYAHSASRQKFEQLPPNVLEYLEIDNCGTIRNHVLPKYNDYGILVECTYEDNMPTEGIVPYNPKNDFKSVFDSEIQIPLELLEKKFGDNIYLKIRLRGGDIALKGESDIIRRNLFSVQQLNEVIETRKLYEMMFYTEFMRNIMLSDIN